MDSISHLAGLVLMNLGGQWTNNPAMKVVPEVFVNYTSTTSGAVRMNPFQPSVGVEPMTSTFYTYLLPTEEVNADQLRR